MWVGGGEELGSVAPEGWWARATFQVAAVTRPCCSVSNMCDLEHRVMFEYDGGGGYVDRSFGVGIGPSSS